MFTFSPAATPAWSALGKGVTRVRRGWGRKGGEGEARSRESDSVESPSSPKPPPSSWRVGSEIKSSNLGAGK